MMKPPEENAIAVCLRARDRQPSVPSRKERCIYCGQEVWISLVLVGRVRPACEECTAVVIEEEAVVVAPETAAELRALGYSDDQIEKAREFGERKLRNIGKPARGKN